MSENVKVAVRVRPFNEREKTRNAHLVIKMVGNSTRIYNPSDLNGEPRKFTFDYSYWSHDGYEEDNTGYLHPVTDQYADQKRVFNDLGEGVLENAWKGYNCSLFAYGQTGSGKSYSMVGYGANKGIVPVTCEKLFEGIRAKEGSGDEFQVALSMLEIYNEQTRDLLNIGSAQKGGLKVRESQSKGFYVENLLSVAVKNYAEIEQRIAQGTKNRTVASTNMNATSSRAHTIVAINFKQKTKNTDGQMMQRTSIINLVDLAGSERAESTGATGARLKEGAAINKSLSTLGNVIKALAEGVGDKKVVVPYRDSVLTKLLKNALGGNSKTIMIAALSPADINYDETLSTLRFADRAKSIKTRATINESPTDKLIRELREENSRLLEMLKGMKTGVAGELGQPQGVSEEEISRMRSDMEEELARNLERNQLEMDELQKSWKQKLSESERVWEERDREERRRQEKRKTTPHFWNLNEDPLLTNSIIHLLLPGVSLIGNDKAKKTPEILLNGLSILPEHGEVENDGNNCVTLSPLNKSKILLNGRALEGKEELHHNDRSVWLDVPNNLEC